VFNTPKLDGGLSSLSILLASSTFASPHRTSGLNHAIATDIPATLLRCLLLSGKASCCKASCLLLSGTDEKVGAIAKKAKHFG